MTIKETFKISTRNLECPPSSLPGYRLRDCQLDTGADDTVFPEAVAGKIGVDLSAAPAIQVQLVGSSPLRYELLRRKSAGLKAWTANESLSVADHYHVMKAKCRVRCALMV